MGAGFLYPHCASCTSFGPSSLSPASVTPPACSAQYSNLGNTLAFTTGERTGAAFIIGCALVTSVAVHAFTSFTVSISSKGISYWSPIKVPNTSLDYPEFVKVELAQISPGGVGLMAHSGGRVTKITCGNPEVGAGLAARYIQ